MAEELSKRGAKITLILGPVGNAGICPKNHTDIKLIRFRFFDELKNILREEIKSGRYDVLIHTAAVSDYKPSSVYSKKIKSGIRGLKLILEPTSKIIDSIKKIAPGIFLVGFKFEPGAAKKELIRQAKRLILRSQSDLAVGNDISGHSYRAYIVSKQGVSACLRDKKQLAAELIQTIEKRWQIK